MMMAVYGIAIATLAAATAKINTNYNIKFAEGVYFIIFCIFFYFTYIIVRVYEVRTFSMCMNVLRVHVFDTSQQFLHLKFFWEISIFLEIEF